MPGRQAEEEGTKGPAVQWGPAENEEDMSKTPTVDQAMTALRRAIDDDARQNIADGLHHWLGRKPMLANARIEGCEIHASPDGDLTVRPASKNGHAPKPKRKYRLSAAGRAKRIKAVRAYWAKRRKAGKS